MTIHAQTTCTLSTIPAKTSLLKGHFLFSDGYANVIENVDNSSSNWKSNVHIGANGIQLRYNNIILSEWVAKTITPTGGGASIDPNFTFYYPKEEQTSGSGGESLLVPVQGLSALKLSAGGMSLYRDSGTNESESIRKLFDLGNNGLIFYSGDINSTPIAHFNGSGAQIGQTNQSHLLLDYHSMRMVDLDGNSYLYISDLRGSDGKTHIVDEFISEGDDIYYLTFTATSSDYTVTVSDGSGGHITFKDNERFGFINGPTPGAIITVEYDTMSEDVKAYTIGMRGTGEVGASSAIVGTRCVASGKFAYAEGWKTTASGGVSHAEGYSTTASSACSHAEGDQTMASGPDSHAEGSLTTASGWQSHAEGYGTIASGWASHIEGKATIASGEASHAEGAYTTSSHEASHAGGRFTKTSRDSQTVIGEYNKDNSSALFIVGNGSGRNNRSNALEVDTSGNVNIPSGAKYKINGTALSASDVGAVPTSRTVNNKALSSNITLTASDVGALATSGGNITGNLSYKLSSIDASLANNGVSSTQYPTTFNILDKSERILTRKEAIIESNGNIGSYWYVRNYNTSGTQVAQKGIKMTMDKSGNLTYTIQDAANFRTALGLGSLATKSSLSASDVGALPSNYFIFDTYSKQITVEQGATNITMGTLTQHSGYTLRGYINLNGGYTDQWLISYGTYGSNVVAMVYSKYNGSLTQTISCTAVWTKNS